MWIGDEILPEIGKKSSPAINPEDLIVGMPVKMKSVGPVAYRLLEASDEELLARRHLRAVIRERVDWHVSRRNHGGHYKVYLPTVRVDKLDEAVAIAKECPGLDYGISVELRLVDRLRASLFSINIVRK